MLVHWILILSQGVCLSALLWTEILGSYHLLVRLKAKAISNTNSENDVITSSEDKILLQKRNLVFKRQKIFIQANPELILKIRLIGSKLHRICSLACNIFGYRFLSLIRSN